MRKIITGCYGIARLTVAAILVWAVAAAAAFAGQSLVLAQSGRQSFSLPGQSRTASWRVEFQLHDVGVPLSDTNILGMSGFITRLYSGGKQFYVAPQGDSYPGGTPCIFNTTGRSNMLVRIQRDYSAMKYYCEIWEADGSNYTFQTLTILSVKDTGPNGYIDGRYSTAKLGFLRMSNTLVPLKSRPPVTAETGNELELKFDGDTKDSSGKKRDMDASGFSFAPTPGQMAFALPATPDTPPWAPFITLRARHPSKLTSHSYSMADASPTVDCHWVQLEGPSDAIFDNRASCEPTLTGLVFGPYKFRLAVTDSAGSTASADFDVGAVAYDKKGVVIYPDERLYSLLGPSLVLGANPWEWADSQSVKMAVKNWDNYKINGGTWDAEWLYSTYNGMDRAGTVYTRAGISNKLYGVGTNFLEVFCGGKAGPVSKPMYISVALPTVDPNDEPSRYPRYVASCESDTELTFVSGWVWERPQISAPGVTWGTMGDCPDCSTWNGRNFASDVNYYDNALAHYALYYRTGWRKARDSARWMADRYAYSPWIGGGINWVPRHASLASAFLRATVDTGNPPEKNVWPLLRSMVDNNCAGETTSANPISDPRESGYCLAFTALKAKLDPDTSARTASLERLVIGYTNRWGSQQRPAGNYVNNGFEGDFSHVHSVTQGSATVTRYSGTPYPSDYCGTALTEAGTITVANTDRVSVTGDGTNFTGSAGKIIFLTGTLGGKPWSMAATIASDPAPTATAMKLNQPWRGDPSSVTKYRIMDAKPAGRGYWTMFMAPVNAANKVIATMDEDSWYYCTVINGDTLMLDKPYTRDTSNGNIYRRMTWQNLTGRGSQPFMMGIIAWAEYLAADALDGYDNTAAANYREAAGKVVHWIWSIGRSPATKGMRYGIEFSNCTVLDYPSAFECWTADSRVERAYNIETINAFSRRYLDTRSATDKTIGDSLFNDTYAKAGYASPFESDGHFNTATDDGSYGWNFWLQTKNYGQAWGVGGGQTWPAARLGGVASPIPRNVQVGFSLSSIQGAVSTRIQTTSPSGQTAITNCGDRSPCQLNLDKRFGSYWMKLEYISSSGTVVAASESQLIQVP